MEEQPKRKLDLSLISLIMVNMLPIGGVIFLDWSPDNILFSYRAESAIICFYTFLKILKVGPLHIKGNRREWNGLKGRSLVALLFFFFIMPVGAFLYLFYSIIRESDVLTDTRNLATIGYFIGILLISHGISFFTNFLGKREFEHINPLKLFISPYPRLLIMWIGIVIGIIFFSIIGFPGPTGPAILLVIFKTIFDGIGHLREHRKYAPPIIPSNATIIECDVGKVRDICQDLEKNKMTLNEIQRKYGDLIN